MAFLRSALLVTLLVVVQGFLLSKLFGGGLLVRGTFLSRAVVIALVGATTFVCLNFAYRPRIKSAAKKAVLVTGCDTGFGNRLAQKLEARGFTVFAGCLDTESEGAQRLRSETGLIHVLQLDVTSDSLVEAACAKVVEVLRREGKYLWAIVNNAGIGHLGFIEMLPMSSYEEVFAVNTLGVVRVTRAFIPLLRGHGRVINVTSLASRVSYPYFSAYSMSKYATLSFSDCLRREMAPFKVKVITVEPSRYRTSLIERTRNVDFFLKLWDSTPEYIRSQYGREYFNECARCMGAHLADARANIDEVVDSIEDAIWSITPLNHYIPLAKTAFRFRLLSFLPESIMDQIATSLSFPQAIGPKCSCRMKTSSNVSSEFRMSQDQSSE